MIQISTCVDTLREIEKQTNKFFQDNKGKIKYVDIKFVSVGSSYYSAMIIYDLIEEDSNTLKL